MERNEWAGLTLKNYQETPEPEGHWIGSFRVQRRGKIQEDFFPNRIIGFRIIARRSSPIEKLSEASEIALLYKGDDGRIWPLVNIKTDSFFEWIPLHYGEFVNDMVYDKMVERQKMSEVEFDITRNSSVEFAQGMVYRLNSRWRNRIYNRYENIYLSFKNDSTISKDSIFAYRSAGMFPCQAIPEVRRCEPGEGSGLWFVKNEAGILTRLGPGRCEIPGKWVGVPGWIGPDEVWDALAPDEKRFMNRLIKSL